jgi:hypothetical protein
MLGVEAIARGLMPHVLGWHFPLVLTLVAPKSILTTIPKHAALTYLANGIVPGGWRL